MNGRKFGEAYVIALSAVLAALSLVFLYLSAVLPFGWLGFIAIAGLLPAAAIVSGGVPAGLFCYVVTAVLSVLLLPGKESAILYILLFGHYPVLKYWIERIRKLPLEWALKLIVANGLFAVLWFSFRAAFLPQMPAYLQAPLPLFLAGTAAFVLYDIGFTKLIGFYVVRIDRYRRK